MSKLLAQISIIFICFLILTTQFKLKLQKDDYKSLDSSNTISLNNYQQYSRDNDNESNAEITLLEEKITDKDQDQKEPFESNEFESEKLIGSEITYSSNNLEKDKQRIKELNKKESQIDKEIEKNLKEVEELEKSNSNLKKAIKQDLKDIVKNEDKIKILSEVNNKIKSKMYDNGEDIKVLSKSINDVKGKFIKEIDSYLDESNKAK